jgi:hypothetical protein
MTTFAQVFAEVQFTSGTWTDISQWVNGFTASRPSTRTQGPLISWQGGIASLLLDNADGRFDPDNLAGPYTATSALRTLRKTLTAGSGAWTAPLNLSGGTIRAQCWASGAAGANGAVISGGTVQTNAGGGSGEYAEEPALAVTPGGSYAWLVPGPAAGDGSGATFAGDSTTVHAHGGNAPLASGAVAGGTKGTGSSNSIHEDGAAGGAGTAGGSAGGGGASSGGTGGPGNPGSSSGAPGATVPGGGPGAPGTHGAGSKPSSGPGGGGSGSGPGTPLAPVGKGAAGKIVITYSVIVPSATVTQLIPMTPVRIRAIYSAAAADGTFEAGVTNWTPTGCTFAQSAAQAHSGTKSGLMTVSGSPVQAHADAVASVTGNAQYLMSMWAYSAAGVSGVSPGIDWYDASAVYISSSAPAPSAVAAATWTQFTFTATSPSNAVTARYRPSLGGSPANGTALFVDDVQFSGVLWSGYADSWTDQSDGVSTYDQVTLPCSDAFKVLAGIILAVQGSSGSGDDSGDRVNRILDAAGWDPDARRVDEGDSLVQATTFGDSALSLLQLTADTEIGSLYAGADGAVVFRHRQALLTDARSVTPQVVLGDLPGTVQAAGTEVPYAGVTRARDDTNLANDVQATRVGGTLQEAQDLTSQSQYLFVRSYARSDLLLTTDAEAQQWAQWVLYVSKDAAERFDHVDVDPMADPASLFPQLLGRDIGDRIQVWRRPAGVASPITKDCFIRGITLAYDSPTQSWAGSGWDLQPADQYAAFLTLDDPVSGRLDYNGLGY